MLFLLFVLSCLRIFGAAEADSDKIVSKYENVFNRTREREFKSQEFPDATDFLESTVTLLTALKNGDRVLPERLNQFSQGLNQYYLSKAHDYYYATVKPLNETYIDPICIPNTTSENVEFYRVKIFGFPGFKKNARVRQDIDTSPSVKNYTMHFKATSDVTIINGFFKMQNEQYYFVYHTYDNVYTIREDKIRTNDGLLKPKSTVESFDVRDEIFVHTCDSTEERYANVSSTIYPTFRKVLRETYVPKLAWFVEGVLRPNYPDADANFGKVYRTKLREALLASAKEYLRGIGRARHEFSPQKLTRETGLPSFTAVYTYKATVDGYLDYTTYEFNSTESEVDNGTMTLFMYDTVTLRYPENVSTMTIVVTDHKNASYSETFKIKSVDIMTAYKASLSSIPIHVYRNLEKWRLVQTGFFSKIQFHKLNPFYNFVVNHVQLEFAKLLGTGFPP